MMVVAEVKLSKNRSHITTRGFIAAFDLTPGVWHELVPAQLVNERVLQLEHALRTMLAAVADAPEQFPGQNAAYLQTVAIPRAQKALSGEPE